MAYSPIEQSYIDGIVAAQFPDPEPQPEPVMLADSGQVKSDAQQGFGTIGPIPRNKAQEALGYVGEMLTKAGVELDKVGLDIPALGRITLKDLTVGDAGKVIEDMSYGFMPVEGGGNPISGTLRIKPDAALELMNVIPSAGAIAKAGAKGAVKAGKALAPKAYEMAEDYMVKNGFIQNVVPNEIKFPKSEKIDTPEFKNWFGESKVVDQSGAPVVVYHGTDKEFKAFDPKKGAQQIIWFTSDKGAIDAGQVGAAGKGKVIEMYATIKNPASWKEYDKYSLNELESRGYDGVILPEKDGTFTGFAFEPTQFKATANKGTFNPKDKNLYRGAAVSGGADASQQEENK